jgi:hypothetical protein
MSRALTDIRQNKLASGDRVAATTLQGRIYMLKEISQCLYNCVYEGTFSGAVGESLAAWLARVGIQIAIAYSFIGAIIAYFLSSDMHQFLYYAFAIAMGMSSQVAVVCLVVCILEMRRKD